MNFLFLDPSPAVLSEYTRDRIKQYGITNYNFLYALNQTQYLFNFFTNHT